VGLGGQASFAAGASGGDPAADGAEVDAEEVGDVLVQPALVCPLDGEAAALLQLSGGAFASHEAVVEQGQTPDKALAIWGPVGN
jgi:hypothetical protein